jgi:oxamate amidohydrolase
MTQCAIATPHTLATEAGVAAYRRGGNAVDAALAAAATLSVVYPHMVSIGGDALALLHTPDGRIAGLNGSGAAPAATSPEVLGGEMPLTGPGTVTVPGAVRTWDSLSQAARLPLAAALEAAIVHASEGVPVAGSLARGLEEHAAALAHDPGARDVLFRDGALLREGESLVQPALARSLEAIAALGAEAFYGPQVGGALVEGLRALGSPMTLDDLREHQTDRVEPLSGQFGPDEVLTLPPNSQGYLLLQALAALEQLGAGADPLGRDAAILAELFRLGSLDRDLHLADPRVADVPLERLLSPEHTGRLLERAREGVSAVWPEPTGRPGGDTVAVVAADAEGNAVSLIQSIFHSFGAKILEPRTGIVCHNRGAFFTLDPSSPNVLAPGKRPAHTLMPVLVRRDGRLVGVHGTMGGKAQAQIHTQLMLRTARGEDAASAVSAPRWVVGGLDAGDPSDLVLAESRVHTETLEHLAGSGMRVVTLGEVDETVGHSVMIRIAPDGALSAASDPRADGSAAAFEA